MTLALKTPRARLGALLGMMAVSLAAPAHAQYGSDFSEDMSGADKGTLENSRNASRWELEIRRHNRFMGSLDRMKQQHEASKRTPEQRRIEARGARIIKAGRASLRYSPGAPERSPFAQLIAREIIKDPEAARQVSRTRNPTEIKRWVATRLRIFPQTLRGDLKIVTYDARNLADVLSACTLISWIFATGRTQGTTDAQAVAVRDATQSHAHGSFPGSQRGPKARNGQHLRPDAVDDGPQQRAVEKAQRRGV